VNRVITGEWCNRVITGEWCNRVITGEWCVLQAVEKFAENVERIQSVLSHLCTDLQQIEFPNDVVQTELLRADHRASRQEFIEDLQSTVHHGEALRDCLTDVTTDADNPARHRTELPQDRLEHIDAVERSGMERVFSLD